MAQQITWDPKQGVYTYHSGVSHDYNPSGNVYYNPQSGTYFAIGADGQPHAQGANETSYWDRVFANQRGQAPGSTDTGQTFNGQNIEQSPQGTYYYQQGGKNYALNADQLKGLNLPQIAGYDQAGNPYYSTPTAESQNTPQQNAFADLAKTDPRTANLIGQLSSYYGNMGRALKTGGTVATPQIQQAARAAQVARGNMYGTAQASQEAMSTGLEGEQEAQQLQSYLNSGTTPIAEGSRQLSDIINQYGSSNQNIPFQSTYNPQNTFTYYNPASAQQFAQGANNWYNSANSQYLGAGYLGNQGTSALQGGIGIGAGALGGAASGALAGSAAGGVGAIPGAIIGGLAGAFGGASRYCWVAREVYGQDNPKWKVFRDWMLEDSPKWFRKLYINFGKHAAFLVRKIPFLKEPIRKWMDKKVEFKLRKELVWQ